MATDEEGGPATAGSSAPGQGHHVRRDLIAWKPARPDLGDLADLGAHARRAPDHPHRSTDADRLERLQHISIELAAAETIGDITAVIQRWVGVDGTARGFWLVSPDGSELRLAGQQGLSPSAVEHFLRMPMGGDLPGAIACRERRTVVSTSATDAVAEFDELADIERTAEGFVAVPFVIDDLSLGVLGLGIGGPPTHEELAFLEAVAGQIAQTLVRVRLAQRDARRRFELEFLGDISDVVLSATHHLELMRAAAQAAVPRLGDWCILRFVGDGSGAPLFEIAHRDPERAAWLEDLVQRYSFNPESPRGLAAVLRTGETEHVPRYTPEVIDELLAHAAIPDADGRAIIEELRLTSSVTVPLRTEHRVVGAMQFVTAESGRTFDEDDVALAEVVGRRLAEALDSAWLNDHHRDISETLQRALLPPRLPAIPGLDVAARYWPAGGSEVGGDFYDIFRIRDDEWAVLIGDACGTGANAAALSSIVRHTCRAAARHGVGHRTVMEWINEAVLRSDRDLFCTACYSTVRRTGRGWRVRSISCGHPRPIIARGTECAEAPGEHGTLLGVFERIQAAAVDVDLDPGDAIVFFTDGVTDLPEPYGLDPDGMVDLVRRLNERGTAAGIADGIDESIRERVPLLSRRDDVAVVVLRVEPEVRRRS